MKLKDFREIFKSDESRFVVSVGIKTVSIFMLGSFFVFYLYWVTISLNSIFFEAYGFYKLDNFREVFFDIILSTLLDGSIYYFSFLVILFFMGCYLGILLLRPFKVIGSYCEGKINEKEVEYNPDIFSDYRLLTRFSEFFFSFLDACKIRGELTSMPIPSTFLKIKKPVFEKVFFFHFMLLILIILIVAAFFLSVATFEIQASINEFATHSLKNIHMEEAEYFFRNQDFIFSSSIIILCSLLTFFYIILGLHLYSKVNGAIFAFFLTMRSIMKGKFSSRIHLVGYGHVRPYSRMFNKYIDKLERELEKR